MDVGLIKEALLESGWQASFAFPTASKENIALLKLFTEIRAKVQESTEEFQMYAEKNLKLRDHIELVKNERKLTQDLRAEVETEIESLSHFIKLAEKENWRTGTDLKKMSNQTKKIIIRQGSLEDEIFLKSNDLTSIKSELDCDQKLVERYLEDCETDLSLKKRIKKLSKLDTGQLNFLCGEESKLNKMRLHLRSKLDTFVSRNDVLQLRIDNISNISRDENKGRREMLELWEKTVKQMSNRDNDYKNLGKDYDELLEDIRDKNAKKHGLDTFLGNIEQEIVDSKRKGACFNKKSSDLRITITTESNDILTTESDYLVLDKSINKTEKELSAVRLETRQQIENVKQSIDEIRRMEKTIAILRLQLEKVHDETLSADDLLKMVEEEMDNEAKCQKLIHERQDKLERLKFDITQEKIAADHDKKTVEALISGARNTLRVANRDITRTETEVEKLDNLLYNSMLNGHYLEQRIARLEEAVALDEVTIALEEKIKKLTDYLNHRNKTASTLSAMVDQFINNKRILKMQMDKINEDLVRINDQMDNIQVILSCTKRSLDNSNKEKNELLVFYNMSRYQFRRAEAHYRMTEESTLGAEMQCQTIKSLLKELQEESFSRIYRIEMEFRLANNDRNRIKADLVKRYCRLEQVQARYSIDAAIISADGDIEGDKTNYIIKSLEEHEELRVKGDELDKFIRQAEQELQALENTVLVMTSLNENARGYNSTANDPQLINEKDRLEQILEESTFTLKQSRENRRVFRASVLRFTVELNSIDEEISQLNRTTEAHEVNIIGINVKNQELDEKLARASKVQNIARVKAGKVKEHIELDIEVQLLCDFNESVNMLLARTIKASPYASDEILLKAQELSKSFQLTTSILTANVINVKPSDKNKSNCSSAKPQQASARQVQLKKNNLADQVTFPDPLTNRSLDITKSLRAFSNSKTTGHSTRSQSKLSETFSPAHTSLKSNEQESRPRSNASETNTVSSSSAISFK